jgi:ATP-dependent HslUV protease ATP-binding subunit HslU
MIQELSYLTPREIVASLDKYIVGQQSAKRNVAIALRNRWRRMHVTSDIKADITPNNILMIGATGVGKTEIARRLAKVADAPFVKVEASKFTEVGYVGRDVEGMVRDLVEQAVSMVKAAREEEVREKAIQQVEDIILDAVVPPMDRMAREATTENSLNSLGEDDFNMSEQTRERFRQKIRNGELDEKKIDISVNSASNMGISMIGGGMMDESALNNLQDMISSMIPKKAKTRKVTIAEAKQLLLPEEINKLIDMDSVKEEALEKAKYNGIIFIDEMDKIASSFHRGSGPDVSREGVQRDLLPIVEGSTVNTKYGVITTDHILFIAAGAFHISKPSDLIPELQGRFPIRVELDSLSKEDFCCILKDPKNALTKQYIALFEAEKVKLVFEEGAIEEIAEKAFTLNEQIENIGARRLHTVMSHLLNKYLFDVPDKIGPDQEIKVTKDLVNERLADLVKHKELNEYIL